MDRKTPRCFILCIIVLATLTPSIPCKRSYHYYHQHQRNPRHNPEQTFTTPQHFYVIYHYFRSPWEVPGKFSLLGESTTDCEPNISEILCIPNSYLICLSNGTLLCVTDMQNTVTCDFGKPPGVSFKEGCEGNELCDPGQAILDVCMPCLSNVTLIIKKKYYESSSHQVQTMVRREQLCLTVLAQPKKLESPAGSAVLVLAEIGKWLSQILWKSRQEEDVSIILQN